MENKTLRVLQVVDSLGAGGIQAFILNINRNMHLDKIKFDYVVYKNKEETEFYDESVEKMGGQIICLEKNTGIKRLKSFIDLYRLQKDKKYSVVHIHGDRAKSFFEAVVFKICKTPTIIMHSHNDRISRDKRFYHLHLGIQNIIRSLWKYVVNYEFACSTNAAQWMFSKEDVRDEKAKVINNGIDEKKFIYNEEIREEYRRKLNLQDKFVLTHVGRFSYQKNHDFLIDIFNSVNKQYSNSVLLLIGEGELKEKIEDKVRSLNLEDKVIFYGLCNEIHNILQASDIFVFPSHYEGLPVVGIEVQAAALMAVASDAISNEIKITHYWKSVSLDSPPEEWAKIILKYKDGYSRKDTSEDIIKSGFSARAISRNLENLYMNADNNQKSGNK
ncbi:glycosyltransferase family 1 protein [Clostridium beijerinckii]|uniref:Glycosyltransferase involved in cell wall biosynthesis n=1 Tax=Clostridium beijerinckii TaxID=1520 RepID=A0AAE5H1S9_CLOBE|nr:glycosyltransferase family 1 protein [Clostridium beijerinckii]NSB12476.1 glycosyltransferase involved in cell wall biosynthesis [Clostridium beijerinckii]OOM22608.1 putative glycosyltransferase EpsF [Clostridium beijerinckii]